MKMLTPSRILPALALNTAILAFLTPTEASARYAHVLGSSTDHRILCIELGLTPEAMAALDVQGYQVSNIFDEIDDHTSLTSSLRLLQTQLQTSLASLKEAQSDIRHAENQAQEQQMQSQIDAYTSEIESLGLSIEQAQAQIRSAIMPAGISAPLMHRACEPAGTSALLPVEFRFAQLRDEDCAELLNALIAERRAQGNGQQPSTDTQLILNRYRNLPAVLQARSNLLYNLDAVRGAFND